MEAHREDVTTQGFYMLAPSIWVRHPKWISPASSISSGLTETITIGSSSSALSLILLFSWTSASLRSISKYTSYYVQHFPSTPVMLVTTTLFDLAFRSSSSKQPILSPAISYIRSHSLDAKIHVHAFSEGGSNKVIEMARAYLSTTSRRLPVSSISLDSTPGDHQYHRLAWAFSLSLPHNRLLRFFGLVFAYLMLTTLWCFYAFYGRKKNLLTRIRRGLNDQRLWDAGAARRCYLYSEGDKVIKWEDVERHAVKAERRGMQVLRVKFRMSEHCHHVREDKRKYWSGVEWALQIGTEEKVASRYKEEQTRTPTQLTLAKEVTMVTPITLPSQVLLDTDHWPV